MWKLTTMLIGLSLAASVCACAASAQVGDEAPVADAAVEESGHSDLDVSVESMPIVPRVVVQFDPLLRPWLRDHLAQLLRSASKRPVEFVACDVALAPQHSESLVLSFGACSASRNLDSSSGYARLEEGIFVRSGRLGEAKLLVALGSPSSAQDVSAAYRALSYASLALMEELGFVFAHPLSPVVPVDIDFKDEVAIDEGPRWPIRAIHLHTMHPTELADVLNGWGPSGVLDADGWESSRAAWSQFLLWALANRVNRVHWVLLASDGWGEFSRSVERKQRLQRLVKEAHEAGLAVGVDAPMSLRQQNAFRLIEDQGELDDELRQLRSSVDWLMACGFDYLATESGTSEFTHSTSDRMLAWMNELVRHLDTQHGGREAGIKVHCSTGQTEPALTDPVSGGALNINFLPHFADSKLAVYPHTVQHYGLDDPAPTYGNRDFGQIRRFLQVEAGTRPVIWHPESAYWVSFDIDVPLFLPVYAERRVHDLRLIAQDEALGRLGVDGGAKLDGQSVFSSGWEWGYWLNDFVAARAAWNPHSDLATDEDALRSIVRPLSRLFGTTGASFEELLVDTARSQRELLIEGRVDQKAPSDIERRNGQAYLQGTETWDDVSDIASSMGLAGAQMTQPDKLGLVEMRNPLHAPPAYSSEVKPLLREMEDRLGVLGGRWEELARQSSGPGSELLVEFADAASLTALRARQVHGLYDYVDGFWDLDQKERTRRLQEARDALDGALMVVRERESRYRVNPDAIAAWTPGATAYSFRYLWTVRTLYYWWRDEAKAVQAPSSPCYLNIIDPARVGFGEGREVDAIKTLESVAGGLGLGSIAECLTAPAQAPVFPPEGLR